MIMSKINIFITKQSPKPWIKHLGNHSWSNWRPQTKHLILNNKKQSEMHYRSLIFHNHYRTFLLKVLKEKKFTNQHGNLVTSYCCWGNSFGFMQYWGMLSLKNALVNTVQLPCIHPPKLRNERNAITLLKLKHNYHMISLGYLTPEIFDNCPELFSTFDSFLMLSTTKKEKKLFPVTQDLATLLPILCTQKCSTNHYATKISSPL